MPSAVGPITIDSPSPLDPDTLFFRSMVGVEALSQCFEYVIEVSSDTPVNATDLLGVATTVHLETADGGTRHFNGVVSVVDYLDTTDANHYRLVLRPWLWLLTRRANCRIFQDQTVIDIITSVFQECDISDVDTSGLTTDNYKPCEYIVQYRETDFDFVSRLMEREGIYYYFRHGDGQHTLVLVDLNTAHDVPPSADSDYSVAFRPPNKNRADGNEYVDEWQVQNAVESGQYSHADYDFTKSRSRLYATRTNEPGYAHDQLEVYDYPGGFSSRDPGDAYALIRLQEHQTPFEEATGWSNARQVTVGCLFTLVDCPRDDQNQEYLVTSSTVRLTGHQSDGGRRVNQAEVFSCTLTAIASSRQFRPRWATRKPLVRGLQTAIVVGPSGEEIWTDKYGRVKVQFHWDRDGNNDEKSSCWIRVSQVWAGTNWGAIHIPRIGQEVIVDFLEGDPDRPIITGRVYNDANMPPYALPANQTQSGIKSRSTKGGAIPNANELRFEDRKGSEEVYLQAEKDLNSLVKNNESATVGADRSRSVGGNDALTVGKNQTIKIGSDQTINVGANESLTVGGNETISVSGNESDTVGGNQTVSVAGNQAVSIGGNDSMTVGGNQSLTVAAARSELVGGAESIVVGGARSVAVAGAQAVTVGGALTETTGGSVTVNIGGGRSATIGSDENVSISGAQTITIGSKGAINVSQQLVIDAGDELVIKAGDASITLKKNGDIVLKGKNLTSDASGKVSVKAASDLVLKGSKISQN
jgi:type VI secretion system secreted protein VgrG